MKKSIPLYFTIKNILTILLLISTLQLTAQSGFDNVVRKGLVYDRETTVDFKFHTHGYFALGLNIARIKTYYKTQFYHIELGGLRHPREFRQNTNLDPNTLNFTNKTIFGKQNSLYVLRGGWGEKRYFSEKAEDRGVAVGFSYEFGPSIGILKPYYLDLRYAVDGRIVVSSEKYSEDNHDIFLDISKIEGYSGFRFGWDELAVQPGGHLNVAAHLDWGAFDEFVKGLEAGVMVDFYFKKLPILVSDDNRPFFINLYVTLQFGKRW